MPAPTCTLENLWDLEMRIAYDEGVKYCHYRATYFLQMVVDHGGLEAAHPAPQRGHLGRARNAVAVRKARSHHGGPHVPAR
jgi:hypothetical protein